MALTINNYCGFETQGSEEAVATTGTFSFDTTVQRSGGACLKFTGGSAGTWDLPWVAAPVTDAGASYIFAFGLRRSANPGSTVPTFPQIRDDSGGTICSLQLNTNGTVSLRDAQSGVLDTSSALSNNVYNFIEVYADLNSAAGDWEWFINGSSEGSGSGADFTDGNAFGSATSVIRFSNGGVTGDFFVDDAYILSGATAASDRLGGSTLASMPEVFMFQNLAGATATPDAGISGNAADALDVGTWDEVAETPLNITNEVEYQELGDGGTVDSAVLSAGGDIDGDSNIKAIKGIWHLDRDGGGGSVHSVGLGDNADGDSPAATVVALTTTPSNYFVLRESNLPTASQKIRQGFGWTSDGGQDVHCYDMWAMILHVPSVGGPPPTISLVMAPHTPT